MPPPRLFDKMSILDDHLHLDTICRRIATGRHLTRQLAAAVREFEMSEAEFRLLWLLRETEQAKLEQGLLVEGIGSSSAQVSALVEKLRVQQVITPVTDSRDRRRKLWRLTASGRGRFESIFAKVEPRCRHWVLLEPSHENSHSPREDAA